MNKEQEPRFFRGFYSFAEYFPKNVDSGYGAVYNEIVVIQWYNIIQQYGGDNMAKSTKLGDGELEVMQAIWDAGEPVTASSILEKVQQKRTWGLSTLMTVLARLIEKGYLECDKSTRTNIYSAKIEEMDYKKKEGRSFLEKMYGNSIFNFISCLYDDSDIGPEEISQLRRIVENAGKED